MPLEPGLIVPLILSLVFLSPAAGLGAPGKPRLTGCRSPEKETFTCWWEPGDAGGFPTTHALYYLLEGSETVHECPDYQSAGPNSCFFNKNDTSLWVNYNISVVATNAMGQSISEPVEVDVVYIVQPNTPESVTAVVVEDRAQPPYLRVWWEKPHLADTRSGWITLLYHLRLKRVREESWEEFDAGMQKHYKVFSLHPGEEYMLQVRCKPDHGFWSEWTHPVYVQIPEYTIQTEKFWIIVAIFSAFIILIITWIINIKRNSLKHCLLPPVPVPKIKGVDEQLLKSGIWDEAVNALVIRSSPPASHGELLMDCVEVCVEDCDGRTLLPEMAERDSDSVRQEKIQTWPGVLPWPLPTRHYYQQDLYFRQCGISGISDAPLDETSSGPCEPPGAPPSPARYVEVRRVDSVDVLMQPLAEPDTPPCPGPLTPPGTENYSRVQDVTPGELLLLRRDSGGAEVGRCRKADTRSDTRFFPHEAMRLTSNGYVDSAVVTS